MAGADETLCRLVAHHSCALNEATQRNLAKILTAESPLERLELVDALTYCDMTISSDGLHLDVADRLAEIHSRYGPGHLVSRSLRASTPCIIASVRAVEDALARAAQAT